MNSLSSQALDQLSVLIVDDHDINREFLAAALAGAVREVVTAEDGRAAVALCQSRRFDVVLMDLHMPRMDGLSAAKSIRQSGGPSQHARILILTADARPEAHTDLDEHGVDGYLNKPINVARLIRTIVEQVAPGTEAPTWGPDSGEETRLIVPEQALESANGDSALVDRMARLFARELDEKLPELDRLIGSGQRQQASEILHQWRGACGFAGAIRLHQACEALYQRLQEPKTGSTGAAYVDFLRTAHATRQALTAQSTSPT
ncbi:MAG: response regulator [Wenzhouxiangella sp.]|jgi:two-component system sensor histidine kinase BarA|nr:response regulator [Wenzhouxiangella sp.]